VREEHFEDLYEALQVSPNADSDTIDRVFRHLAKRYHPDNLETGNRERFDQLTRAHRILGDPERRTEYDVHYEEGRKLQWKVAREAANGQVFDEDLVLRERLLSLLYVQRRRDVKDPAIGNIELERLLDCPQEHLDFHVWYLKEKKLVERTERGIAITALGVEDAEQKRAHLTRDQLLPERAGNGMSEPDRAREPRHLEAVSPAPRRAGSEA
jgi:curved DNA-binding protein CbpA